MSVRSDYDSPKGEAAQRLARLTYLFLALGIEQDENRMQAWIAATTELTLDQLDLGCRRLAREWKTGAPRPAHLIAAVRERRPHEPCGQREPEGGPWVRLDDMARAMGLDHLSQLADPKMTHEERELCCERYEQAMARGEVRLYPVLPGAGERYR